LLLPAADERAARGAQAWLQAAAWPPLRRMAPQSCGYFDGWPRGHFASLVGIDSRVFSDRLDHSQQHHNIPNTKGKAG